MSASIVHLQDIRKTYQMGLVTVEALRGVNIDIEAAEYVSIMGPSGCGKPTLLNVLGCLDRATSGRYVLGEHDISQLDDNALSSVRGSRLGFIFQSYNLIQQLTVVENIEVPLYYQGRPEAESRAVAEEMATLVGLANRLDHKPYELSGGQQQRVAIARALVNDPLVILADEPTGNLDSAMGAEIMQLIARLNRERGITVLMVTHDATCAAYAPRQVVFRDGRIVNDTRKAD